MYNLNRLNKIGLERRFELIETRDIRKEFISGLEYNNPEPLKNKLSKQLYMKDMIFKYFKNKKLFCEKDYTHSFKRNFSLKINPESIKDIFLGMYISKNGRLSKRSVPSPILEGLCGKKEWEKWSLVYFFSGIWDNSVNEDINYPIKTLYGIIRRIIFNGLDSVDKKNRSSLRADPPFKNKIKSSFNYPIKWNLVDTSFIDFPSESKSYMDDTPKQEDPFSDFNNPPKNGGGDGLLF